MQPGRGGQECAASAQLPSAQRCGHGGAAAAAAHSTTVAQPEAEAAAAAPAVAAAVAAHLVRVLGLR